MHQANVGNAGNAVHGPATARTSTRTAAHSSAHTSARRELEQQLPQLRLRLLRHGHLAVADPGLAEDLVQDTLMAVLQGYQQRRGSSSLTTWATAILRHKIADWYRGPERHRLLAQDSGDLSQLGDVGAAGGRQARQADCAPASQEPQVQAERSQMLSNLQCCVSCLPQQAGRVFMMREWLGFKNDEISQSLGLSVDNCRTILHRAKASLRSCMTR